MKHLVLSLLLAATSALAADAPSFTIAESTPLALPRTPENCTLVCYNISPKLLGDLTRETLAAFLQNNGFDFKSGGFAVYLTTNGSLLVAATDNEHKLFGAGLSGD